MVGCLSLTNGASVRLVGNLVDSPAKGQEKEFVVEDVRILGGCDPEVGWLTRFSSRCSWLNFRYSITPSRNRL